MKKNVGMKNFFLITIGLFVGKICPVTFKIRKVRKVLLYDKYVHSFCAFTT